MRLLGVVERRAASAGGGKGAQRPTYLANKQSTDEKAGRACHDDGTLVE